jgi:hypothetical protein
MQRMIFGCMPVHLPQRKKDIECKPMVAFKYFLNKNIKLKALSSEMDPAEIRLIR